MTSPLEIARPRRSFGKRKSRIQSPHLLHETLRSYSESLQAQTPPNKRTATGLQSAFKDVFPLFGKNPNARLEFVNYSIGKPRLSIGECRRRNATFEAALHATLRLVLLNIAEDGSQSVAEIREQTVHMGNIPLMSPAGSFIINGAERSVVSQLHRSPGLYLSSDDGKTHGSGKILYTARIIPHRGSWIDFESDAKDCLYVRIDRKRKIPASVILRALGMSQTDILSAFHESAQFTLSADTLSYPTSVERLSGALLSYDIVDTDGTVLAPKGRRINLRVAKSISSKLDHIVLPDEDILGKFIATDLIDPASGELLAEANSEISPILLAKAREAKISTLFILRLNDTDHRPHMSNTLRIDETTTVEEAKLAVFRVLRPGEPPTADVVATFFDTLFSNSERYDLSDVGRIKLDEKLGRVPAAPYRSTLDASDLLGAIKALADILDGNGTPDDIDHLGNRRVRCPGELVSNLFSAALSRSSRTAKERIGAAATEGLMPADLINGKAVSQTFREFFQTSALSQFMDQTNPLSELSHKRRISALGPGGLTRERAGFEARDVHATHYGRLCPIESPEGQNIGLISSMALSARLNEHGFLETPYIVVNGGQVSDEVIWMGAAAEKTAIIAQACAKVDANNKLEGPLVGCRVEGEFSMVSPEKITHIDVGTNQTVSLAASLIPFLEHDDANRALMGANMQRQAVPCLRPEKALVGTGIERQAALESGSMLLARRGGVIEYADARRIVVRANPEETIAGETGLDSYPLQQRTRSNQNTSIFQRPCVRTGQHVSAGDALADGAATDMGELALGQNLLVAFMPWRGYNYEDSILISERVVSDDRFTTIHIEELSVTARDTKLGSEEITADIPSLGATALANIDECGIVYIGAEVSEGMVLVGKTTPKGETQLTPEEKLLHAIFGSKAAEVKDTSLRVPAGIQGTVIDVQVLHRHGIEPCARSLAIAEEAAKDLRKDSARQRKALEQDARTRVLNLVTEALAAGSTVKLGRKSLTTAADIQAVDSHLAFELTLSDEAVATRIEELHHSLNEAILRIEAETVERIAALTEPADLGTGALKTVKVMLAVKRRLQPGDKMAGRHGNKGVVSRILPIEDMPHLADGTPMDIVLNPLGVPSRMNIGQVLETHLGWACQGLGKALGRTLEEANSAAQARQLMASIYGADSESAHLDDAQTLETAANLSHGVTCASPVFDGATEEEIRSWLRLAGLPETGQTTLYDGLTGDAFKRQVTVGIMHIIKLHHLVDEKMHARSTGPYSMVTQQPLGGRAHNGGQRLGEMEVWALEAYGAAHILQEMLTVKSDDVEGRTKTYQSIVSGKTETNPGMPESFNVLVSEIRALGIDLSTEKKGDAS